MIDQGELFEIENPCRGVCESNNRGYCKGCMRKREERLHWNEFTPFQKQLIVNLCARRKAKVIAARLAKDNEVDDSLTDDEASNSQLALILETGTSVTDPSIPSRTSFTQMPESDFDEGVKENTYKEQKHQETSATPTDQLDMF